MPSLTLVYDRKFQRHRNPGNHPETPQRVSAIERKLHQHGLMGNVAHVAPRPAQPNEIFAVHTPAYVERLHHESETARATNRLVRTALDTNTWVSPDSYETAMLAAGAGLVAVESVGNGTTSNAFVPARPPGHHALADRSYGYCLFNNVAIAARHAQKKLGLKRVLVIDWDVHHGNGTQDIFYDDPSVCFISIHQYPLWPADSGWITEDGRGEGRGYNINVPLSAGTGDVGYAKVWERIVEPIAMEYQPELILLSAGYDAHEHDPLGQQLVTTTGYYMLSQKLDNLSKRCNSKTVCLLEGGYNELSLAEGAVATISVLAANDPQSVAAVAGKLVGDLVASSGDRSTALTDERIGDVRRHFQGRWRSLRN